MTFEPGLVVRTRVKADRIDDFEQWLHDAFALLAEHRPDAPELRLFREWVVDDALGDTVEYMLFSAGSDLSALDLEPLLNEAYGSEQGRAQLARFEGMLSAEQDVWRLQPFEA